MRTTKKGIAFAVAAGAWTTALGSASALAYDLNRSPHVTDAVAQTETPWTTALAGSVEPVLELDPVVYMPAMTIVGRVHRARAGTAKPAAATSEMRCAHRSELDIGSGFGQACE